MSDAIISYYFIGLISSLQMQKSSKKSKTTVKNPLSQSHRVEKNPLKVSQQKSATVPMSKDTNQLDKTPSKKAVRGPQASFLKKSTDKSSLLLTPDQAQQPKQSRNILSQSKTLASNHSAVASLKVPKVPTKLAKGRSQMQVSDETSLLQTFNSPTKAGSGQGSILNASSKPPVPQPFNNKRASAMPSKDQLEVLSEASDVFKRMSMLVLQHASSHDAKKEEPLKKVNNQVVDMGFPYLNKMPSDNTLPGKKESIKKTRNSNPGKYQTTSQHSRPVSIKLEVEHEEQDVPIETKPSDSSQSAEIKIESGSSHSFQASSEAEVSERDTGFRPRKSTVDLIDKATQLQQAIEDQLQQDRVRELKKIGKIGRQDSGHKQHHSISHAKTVDTFNLKNDLKPVAPHISGLSSFIENSDSVSNSLANSVQQSDLQTIQMKQSLLHSRASSTSQAFDSNFFQQKSQEEMIKITEEQVEDDPADDILKKKSKLKSAKKTKKVKKKKKPKRNTSGNEVTSSIQITDRKSMRKDHASESPSKLNRKSKMAKTVLKPEPCPEPESEHSEEGFKDWIADPGLKQQRYTDKERGKRMPAIDVEEMHGHSPRQVARDLPHRSESLQLNIKRAAFGKKAMTINIDDDPDNREELDQFLLDDNRSDQPYRAMGGSNHSKNQSIGKPPISQYSGLDLSHRSNRKTLSITPRNVLGFSANQRRQTMKSPIRGLDDDTHSVQSNQRMQRNYYHRLLSANKLEELEHDIDDDLKEDHDDPVALYARAKVHEKKKEYNEAIADFTKVIEIDPSFKNAVYGKANCLNMLGKYDEAIETYNLAFKQDKEHVDVECLLPPRMSAIRRESELAQKSGYKMISATPSHVSSRKKIVIPDSLSMQEQEREDDDETFAEPKGQIGLSKFQKNSMFMSSTSSLHRPSARFRTSMRSRRERSCESNITEHAMKEVPDDLFAHLVVEQEGKKEQSSSSDGGQGSPNAFTKMQLQATMKNQGAEQSFSFAGTGKTENRAQTQFSFLDVEEKKQYLKRSIVSFGVSEHTIGNIRGSQRGSQKSPTNMNDQIKELEIEWVPETGESKKQDPKVYTPNSNSDSSSNELMDLEHVQDMNDLPEVGTPELANAADVGKQFHFTDVEKVHPKADDSFAFFENELNEAAALAASAGPLDRQANSPKAMQNQVVDGDAVATDYIMVQPPSMPVFNNFTQNAELSQVSPQEQDYSSEVAAFRGESSNSGLQLKIYNANNSSSGPGESFGSSLAAKIGAIQTTSEQKMKFDLDEQTDKDLALKEQTTVGLDKIQEHDHLESLRSITPTPQFSVAGTPSPTKMRSVTSNNMDRLAVVQSQQNESPKSNRPESGFGSHVQHLSVFSSRKQSIMSEASSAKMSHQKAMPIFSEQDPLEVEQVITFQGQMPLPFYSEESRVKELETTFQSIKPLPVYENEPREKELEMTFHESKPLPVYADQSREMDGEVSMQSFKPDPVSESQAREKEHEMTFHESKPEAVFADQTLEVQGEVSMQSVRPDSIAVNQSREKDGETSMQSNKPPPIIAYESKMKESVTSFQAPKPADDHEDSEPEQPLETSPDKTEELAFTDFDLTKTEYDKTLTDKFLTDKTLNDTQSKVIEDASTENPIQTQPEPESPYIRLSKISVDQAKSEVPQQVTEQLESVKSGSDLVFDKSQDTKGQVISPDKFGASYSTIKSPLLSSTVNTDVDFDVTIKSQLQIDTLPDVPEEVPALLPVTQPSDDSKKGQVAPKVMEPDNTQPAETEPDESTPETGEMEFFESPVPPEVNKQPSGFNFQDKNMQAIREDTKEDYDETEGDQLEKVSAVSLSKLSEPESPALSVTVQAAVKGSAASSKKGSPKNESPGDKNQSSGSKSSGKKSSQKSENSSPLEPPKGKNTLTINKSPTAATINLDKTQTFSDLAVSSSKVLSPKNKDLFTTPGRSVAGSLKKSSSDNSFSKLSGVKKSPLSSVRSPKSGAKSPTSKKTIATVSLNESEESVKGKLEVSVSEAKIIDKKLEVQPKESLKASIQSETNQLKNQKFSPKGAPSLKIELSQPTLPNKKSPKKQVPKLNLKSPSSKPTQDAKSPKSPKAFFNWNSVSSPKSPKQNTQSLIYKKSPISSKRSPTKKSDDKPLTSPRSPKSMATKSPNTSQSQYVQRSKPVASTVSRKSPSLFERRSPLKSTRPEAEEVSKEDKVVSQGSPSRGPQLFVSATRSPGKGQKKPVPQSVFKGTQQPSKSPVAKPKPVNKAAPALNLKQAAKAANKLKSAAPQSVYERSPDFYEQNAFSSSRGSYQSTGKPKTPMQFGTTQKRVPYKPLKKPEEQKFGSNQLSGATSPISAKPQDDKFGTAVAFQLQQKQSRTQSQMQAESQQDTQVTQRRESTQEEEIKSPEPRSTAEQLKSDPTFRRQPQPTFLSKHHQQAQRVVDTQPSQAIGAHKDTLDALKAHKECHCSALEIQAMHSSDFKQAYKLLAKTLYTNPNSGKRAEWYYLAVSCYKLKKYDECVQAVQQVVVRNSQINHFKRKECTTSPLFGDLNQQGNAFLQYMQAKCQLKSKNYKSSFKILSKLHTDQQAAFSLSEKQQIKVLLFLAICQYHLKKYKKSISTLDEMISTLTGWDKQQQLENDIDQKWLIQAYGFRGKANQKLLNFEGAVDDFGNVLDLTKKQNVPSEQVVEFLMLRALSSQEKGSTRQAKNDFERAMKKHQQ